MNYNTVLIRIIEDLSIPIYTRRFANLFRCIIVIKINHNNNKIMAIFTDICRSIITIYYHRLIQVMENNVDPEKSREDYEELKEIVTSIHQEIRTKNNPKGVCDKIEKQLSFYY
jgi:hypothetical protein